MKALRAQILLVGSLLCIGLVGYFKPISAAIQPPISDHKLTRSTAEVKAAPPIDPRPVIITRSAATEFAELKRQMAKAFREDGGQQIRDENYFRKFEEAFRSSLGTFSRSEREDLYKFMPRKLQLLLKDWIISDYESQRPICSSQLLASIANLQDKSFGAQMLEDMRSLSATLAKTSGKDTSDFLLGIAHLASALCKINDPDQMNRLLTYVTNAPPAIQRQIVSGLQFSNDSADFYFLVDFSERLPEADDFAKNLLFMYKQRLKRLNEVHQFGIPVDPADNFPGTPEERNSFGLQLAAEIGAMEKYLAQKATSRNSP